jgi:hypothetical protein
MAVSVGKTVRWAFAAFWHWLISEGLIETNPVQRTAQVSEGRGLPLPAPTIEHSPSEMKKVMAHYRRF